MWFVILALVIVAAYFVYDALRDRRLAESGNNLSTVRRMPVGDKAAPNAAYSGGSSENTGHGQTQPSVNPQNKAGASAAGAAGVAAAGAVSGSERKEQASSGKLHFLDAPIGQKDDLTRIDGIGPVIEGELNTLGIYHYHQIGNFSDADADAVNAELEFPGRIEREKWIPQARKLMTDASAAGSGRATAAAESATSAVTSGSAQSETSAGSQLPGAGAAAVGAVAAGVAMSGVQAAGVQTAGVRASSDRAANASLADGDDDDDDMVITESDLTGAWNTDLMIEIQERLKVLNTRESDAPRLNISREDYRAIKDDDEERFSREQLSALLDRLREL